MHARLFFSFSTKSSVLKVIFKKIKLYLSSSFCWFNFKKQLHFISNILANLALVVKKKRKKTKQNGEWWDIHFGYRGQTPPTQSRSSVPSLAQFLSSLSFHYSSGAGGVCKQKMDSRCVDFNILKIEGGDEIRRNRE